ncbi:thioredoxin-disulfide reductase [candidate division WWE3 bacterium CG08_land_8_20_14_0_20_40_13]|uniref:Thioredoxin reductase n=1 Tax=candidate division WWE3 bacterium CG08_land_8_20_14_0_20_40_13 TaxID=1975084 RepID=A0A2H0XFA1_UNCKA|nr:MAG: thioredoxin-disulfide reductase [candidate division WWE3 bacterium CG08_land_8_20_14_0_20_40_13]
MSNSQTEKLVIIGSGPAGLTSAIYAARANLSPLVVEGNVFGGQLMQTTLVENFPGFPKGIMGPDLMLGMKEQAQNQGTRFISEDVTKVDLSKTPFEILVGEDLYRAESLIIATGAKARWLPLESAERLRGKGVTACATCDGPFFKSKDVLVVGGGDSAMEEASFLSKFCNKIYIVNILDHLNASKAMQERVLRKEQFEVILNNQVAEILGKEKVEAVRLKNTKTGEEKEITVQGVFIAIGHFPASEIFKGQLDLDESGRIKVVDNVKTSVPGVFVAGDVADSKYWQAIVAAGFGSMAAIEAERYLGDS